MGKISVRGVFDIIFGKLSRIRLALYMRSVAIPLRTCIRLVLYCILYTSIIDIGSESSLPRNRRSEEMIFWIGASRNKLKHFSLSLAIKKVKLK